MIKKRPTVVTVMGVLNIVFGGLWMLLYLCIGLLFVVIFIAFGQANVARDPQLNELKELWSEMTREIPGLTVFLVLTVTLSVVLAIVEIISGIGLLRMKNWARLMCIFYGVVVILTSIASLVYRFAILNPGAERAAEKLVARRGVHMGQDPMEGTFNNILEILQTVIGIAYAVILLIVMLLPSVSAAFTGRTALDESSDRGDDEYFDEGYERRRRDQWSE